MNCGSYVNKMILKIIKNYNNKHYPNKPYLINYDIVINDEKGNTLFYLMNITDPENTLEEMLKNSYNLKYCLLNYKNFMITNNIFYISTNFKIKMFLNKRLEFKEDLKILFVDQKSLDKI